jgi:predicted nucleotidyltransferase
MNAEMTQIMRDYFSNKPVHRAFLFGSVVKNKQRPNDIDVLVELDYSNGANYFLFFDMQDDLSRLLNSKVDLVSSNGLSAHIQPIIDEEKVLIYERKNS